MQIRSENFHHRVSVERKVLQMINRHWGSRHQLAGLTMPAINQWAKQNSVLIEKNEVLSLLVEFSARLNIEADKSKQVFDSIPVPSSLEELANRLELLLIP